jgi:hypothetical protein
MPQLDKFPENRFAALEEVQALLRSKRFDLLPFLTTLAKADDAFLRYNFGNLAVTFIVNDGPFSCIPTPADEDAAGAADPGQTVISICLELDKGTMETSATYQFTIDELKDLSRTKRLKVKSLGGR